MPIQETRFSEDQPRDPDGKFGAGSQSDPHASVAVAMAGSPLNGFKSSGESKKGDVKTTTYSGANHTIIVSHNSSANTVTVQHLDSHGDLLVQQTHDSVGAARKELLTQGIDHKFYASRSLSQAGDTEETPMSIERRYSTELRAAITEGDNAAMVLEGYAARYNSLSKDLGGFREIIQPGAFTRSLASSPDVVCLFNHGMKSDVVLGRTTSGTLAVTSDDKGLFFRCQLDPNQQSHRDLHSSVKRGDINECSFAFAKNGEDGDDWKDAKDERGNNFISRTLKDVNLFDVSAVTRPAYNDTSLQARAENVTPEIRSIMSKLIEKRTVLGAAVDQSVEQMLSGIAKALAEKFPCDADDNGCCSSYGKYYAVDTYSDHVIACYNIGPGTGDYFSIPYAVDPDGEKYIFGTPVPVEKEWVPSERNVKDVEELRVVKASQLQATAEAHKSVAAEAQATSDAHAAAADTHTAAAEAIQKAADAKQKEEDAKKACDASHGDCAEKRCSCQNHMCDPEDVYDDFDESDEDDDNKRAAKAAARVEFRAALPLEDGKVRTKVVGDKNVSVRSFAHAADADKTESWKLPTHDADNATRSFGRVDASKVPADKLEEVRGKIATSVAKYANAPMIPGEDRMSPEEIETFHIKFRLALFSNEVTDEVRFSDDQPRDKDGKFGAGAQNEKDNVKAGFASGVKGDAGKQYQAAHEQIQKHLDVIKSKLAEHAAESGKNWGHVGDMKHYAEQVKDVHDSLTHSGEYRFSDDQPRDKDGKFGAGAQNEKDNSPRPEEYLQQAGEHDFNGDHLKAAEAFNKASSLYTKLGLTEQAAQAKVSANMHLEIHKIHNEKWEE